MFAAPNQRRDGDLNVAGVEYFVVVSACMYVDGDLTAPTIFIMVIIEPCE